MSLDFKKVLFELAKKNDIPQLTQIMISAYNDLSQTYLKRKYGPPGYDLEYMHMEWMFRGKYYKIIYDNSIIGGFILDRYEDILFLNYFFIDVPYQHQGVGSQVLKFIDDLSEYCIEANTPDWALRNQEFYKKHDYKLVNTYFDKVLDFTLYIYQKYKN